MPAWQVALFIALVLITDVMVVGAILSYVGNSLRVLSTSYPPTTPLPTAVRRNFQSLRIDMLNLGFSTHIAVDERMIHLQPSGVMRLLRLPGASIPWEAFSNVKHKNTRYAQAKLGKLDVLFPMWAMKVGFPDLKSDSR